LYFQFIKNNTPEIQCHSEKELQQIFVDRHEGLDQHIYAIPYK